MDLLKERFYFPPGTVFSDLCAGDEPRKLRQTAELFGVRNICRENWVEVSGDEENVRRALAFFQSLADLYHYRNGKLDSNDFDLLLRGVAGSKKEFKLEALWQSRIKVGSRRGDIIPRSERQRQYVQTIRSCDVTFGIGPAGTGKTYLAMAMAVESFLTGKVRRIILTRPARESGEKLGFLPGSLEEKVSPYLRPLYDALNDMLTPSEVGELISSNQLEIAPLAFMRGRSLNDAFIILDEAQNTTSEQMLMFLTRMGFGSKCVITGDPSQSDLTGNEVSGLVRAEKTLNKLSEIGFVYFRTSDVVRHCLLEKIINAYTVVEK